jgi:hypothetical protein
MTKNCYQYLKYTKGYSLFLDRIMKYFNFVIIINL